MNKKLIIVGSGQTVLDNKVGDTIDAFDIVVRFNGYQNGLGIYDEYAGTKTDIIFSNNTKASVSHFQKYPKIYNDTTKFIVKRTRKNKPVHQVLLSNNHNIDNIIYYKKIYRQASKENKIITMPNRIQNPTLGLMAIFYCLNKYKDYKIFIYGFDRIVKKIKNRRYMPHYYSKAKNFNTKHAVRIETDIIRKLIHNDFITRLI